MRRNADSKFDCNRYQDYQQRNNKSVQHRLCAGAAEGFEIGVQADGGHGHHDEELAAGAVVFSTLSSILTLPLYALLLTMVLG